MYRYAFLIITLISSSPAFAVCPDKCTCPKFDIFGEIILHIHCDNLQHIPLDLITSDADFVGFQHNNITVLTNIDEQVNNMTQVKELYLNHNHISKIEVNSLRVFTSLRNLQLGYNNISNIPNELFATLPHLNELILDHNRRLILPENGFNTKELECLRISHCFLKEIPLKFFDSMPNIKFLYAHDNQISYLHSNLMTHFQKMSYVNLENNKLKVFQPELIPLLSGIRAVILVLNGNPLLCDCQFKDGLESYQTMQMLNDFSGYHKELPDKLLCFLPLGSSNVNQEHFLNSLACDISKNEDKTVATNTSKMVSNSDIKLNMTHHSYNISNESMKSKNTELEKSLVVNDMNNNNNMWSTSYTALWIVLGIVVVSVVFIVIVVIQKRKRRSLATNSETLSQIRLL